MIPALPPETWGKLRYWTYLLLGVKAVVVAVAGISSFAVGLPGVPEVSVASFALVVCFLGSSAYFLARGYWIGALSTAFYAAASVNGAFASYRDEGITAWSTVVGVTGVALLIVSLPLVLTPNPNRSEHVNQDELPGVRSDV